MYYESNNYLQHYGIKGMKWGVRRYRNYNGSYTQAGLKRYDKAMDTYNKRKSDYKNAKKSGVKGYDLKYKKSKVKEAKSSAKKNYDHLKLDKKADEGKILYSKGYRIRSNAKTTKRMMIAGTAGAAIAGQAYANNFINQKQAMTVASISGATFATGAAIKLINSNKDKKLRAYYSHTSKY